MAQPIEIAFRQVRNHKTVLALNATARGAYVALVNACIIDGYDPLPESVTVLHRLSGASPGQWGKVGALVQEALSATLGTLKNRFENDTIRQLRRIEVAFDSHEKRRLKKRATQFVKHEAHNFVQTESLSLGIMQPQPKATNFRPQNCDMQARTIAKENRNKPLKTLSD